jgi:MoaA/NifB/PqqE/SkfB family radical SAM enzyme
LNPKHKTPLTITAKVWNFCQLGCIYCASGSNRFNWTPGRIPAPGELLDFDRLIQWLHCFTPGAVVHVSGGEPLLWDGIETAVEKLVHADIPTTITTNGLLIGNRPRLLKLPLKWIVTHHRGVCFEKWHRNALLIRDKPHIACRLVRNPEEITQQNAQRYNDFNFAWAPMNGLRIIDWRPRALDFNNVASGTMHLIEPDGIVYPCSCKAHQIGNVYAMTYDRKLAKGRDATARRCVQGGLCPAYQSAVLADSLTD